MVSVFTDVYEDHHSAFLSPTGSEPTSAEQRSGKIGHLETVPKEDGYFQATATEWPTRHSIYPEKLPEQSTDISVEPTSDAKLSANGSSKGSSHAILAKPRQKLLSRREKDNTAQVRSLVNEEMKKKEPGNIQNPLEGAADSTMDRQASVIQEAKSSEMTEVRTLQLTALQNTPFNERLTFVDADTQQEATEGRVVQLPHRLSGIKAFMEEENGSLKIIFTKEGGKYKDIAIKEIEALHGPQTDSDARSINNSLPPQTEMIVENSAGGFPEKSLSLQADGSLLLDLSKEDGTYRANPVLIYDEADDIITPVPSSLAFSMQKHEGDTPIPPPRLSSSSPQEDKLVKISELKNFLEKKYAGPRLITARFKEASDSSVLSDKVADGREMSEGKASTSPYKAKYNDVLKSLKVTDKGFVSQSPYRSQLRSSRDVLLTCHQYQERCPTYIKSQTPKSKDQDDKVRGSPSKTCHPRVLPRESSSPKGSRQEGSPLKTFQINIDPQTKATEGQQVKPIPVPRQKRSPSHEAKQTVITDTELSPGSCPPPLNLMDKGTYFGDLRSLSSSTLPHCKKASENELETSTHLARSVLPEDYQHYLGPQEKAHVPFFHQEQAPAAASESDVVHRPKNALRDLVGNQSDNPTKGTPPRISSWIVQDKDGNSSQGTTNRAWSLSRASSSSELLLSLSISFLLVFLMIEKLKNVFFPNESHQVNILTNSSISKFLCCSSL